MQRVINSEGDAITNVSVFVLTQNQTVGDYYYTFKIGGNFQFNQSNNETMLVMYSFIPNNSNFQQIRSILGTLFF